METSEFNLTITFKLVTYLMIFLCVLNYIDKFLPKFVKQTIKFGRAQVDLTPNFLDVPKSWFTHFYVFAFTLNVILVFCIFDFYQDIVGFEFIKNALRACVRVLRQNYLKNPTVDATTTFLCLFLFSLQTGRRLYECIYVSVFSKTRMNVFIYLMGFFHYFGASWSIIMECPGLCCKGSAIDDKINLSLSALNWNHFVGTAIFLYAFFEQFRSHNILANLRKTGKKVTDVKHKIPYGGLFELVSCPNYFAEILIYISLSIIFGFENYAFNWVAIWVTSNQLYSALMGHRWYTEHFPNYPKNRKAFIPYLF